jgi:DNA-binding NarL/FixJ family response regulator
VKKITLLLVDDHTVVRQGLRVLLAQQPDFEIVGEAGDGRMAVKLAQETAPDVVLMDLAMPFLNGLDATCQILRTCPATRILVLSSYGDEECVAQMLKAGAAGYLLKHTAANELPQAIRELRRGNSFFSPAIARHLSYAARASLHADRFGKDSRELTSRETEVLQLVAEGFSNKEAAVKLGISIKTLEKHRQQVMNKLNIHEVAGLTRYAISRRMVSTGHATAVTPETSTSGPNPLMLRA